MNTRQPGRPRWPGLRLGRDRVAELLDRLQLGACLACGRATYRTRRHARHAARIAAPGVRLRACRCGEFWHLAAPAGRPPWTAWPVTVCALRSPARSGLDLRAEDERSYWGRHGGGPRPRARDRRREHTGTPRGER
ncbi:hypothetical protein [Thermoactinospora rubra]|uniref:hypothetical protein n=1 Tax=Thermoactinospora rubra TaxID=1088767 RepID=UPI00117D6A6B|nr:hypothetical protein [Thermoactinospora rubra]